MPTMYETLMELPLFKGSSHAQISQFLENTHVEFLNFKRGEEILQPGEPRKELLFLISGKVEMVHTLAKGDITMSTIIPPGHVLLATLLFGMVTVSTAHITALTDCSLMRFSKEQYLRLLPSDPLFLLNYLNYISNQAQRSLPAFMQIQQAGVAEWMAFYCSVLAPRAAEQVMFRYRKGALGHLANLDEKRTREQLMELRNAGLITFGPEIVTIPSPRELVEKTIPHIETPMTVN